jgi:CRISPR-associated exonuclease Cas4
MAAIWIAFVLLLIASVLWGVSRWQQSRSGLPPGRIIHIDTMHLRPPEGTFFSANYALAGRPDYLVNQDGNIIPIEVKSGKAPVAPYPSHIFQLAAYGLLIQEHFGRSPSHGILKYKDRAIEISMPPDLFIRLKEILDEMRAESGAGNVPRSHSERARCRACGFRAVCTDTLS